MIYKKQRILKSQQESDTTVKRTMRVLPMSLEMLLPQKAKQESTAVLHRNNAQLLINLPPFLGQITLHLERTLLNVCRFSSLRHQ